MNGGGSSTTVDSTTMSYLTNLTDQTAIYVSATEVSITATPAQNPTTLQFAVKNEFDVYINGQYIDKAAYTWTPGASPQTITFDTGILGYDILSGDTIIVNGRWA